MERNGKKGRREGFGQKRKEGGAQMESKQNEKCQEGKCETEAGRQEGGK